jgi:hypothetical protein
MTEKDAINGWWGVPPAQKWQCPECHVRSPVSEWKEREVYCEECGSHDGRECPNCGEAFDHVWGSERLAEVNK